MQVINLDLEKRDGFNKAITVRRGESGGTFGIKLFDGGLLYKKNTGDTFTFKGLTPNGNYVAKTGTMQADGTVQIVLDGQVTSQAGYYKRAYLEVKNGTTVRTTQDIIFFSLGNSDISRGQAEYYVSELDKLLQQLNNEFDEWLKDREQDYADLLARLVALTNRVTNLETKLDDIIAQLQKNEINTKNVFDQSRFSKPENQTRRRLSDNMFEMNGWAIGMMDNKNTLAMLEPNKTYHTHFIAELMTLNGGELYPVQANAGFALYSGVSGYPTVWIAQGETVDFKDVKVGDKIERSTTFTTPANLNDAAANYRIVGYSRRDNNGVTDMVRIHDMIIQEGPMWTGFQPSADDTLTRFDQDRLRRSVLVDPKMTGTILPTIENGSDGNPTTAVTVNSGGYIEIKNNSTVNRARVYFTATQLGLDVYDSKQAFDVIIKFRSATTLENIEVGYSGGDNAVIKSAYDWQTVGVTVKANTNNAFCIWIGKAQVINIQELYIYPAGTDVTTPRIEKIETTLATVEKSTTGNPEILNNIDLNTVVRAGNYIVYQPTNAPRTMSGVYWYLSVYGFNSANNNNLQVITMRSGLNRRYFRQQVNGNWQEWRWIPGIFSDGRVDTIADDFNNQKETGQYVITTTSNSPTGAASTSWYLEVIRYGSSGNYVLQKATQISNTNRATYQRQFFNGAWTQWDMVYSPYIDQILGTAANANSITYNSTIQIEGTSTSNLPVTGSGMYYLETIARAGNYVMQRATLRNTADRTWTRQNIAGTWTAWVEVLKDTNSLPRVEVTDWKAGWDHYSTGSRLTVRKVNGMVSLDGVATNTVTMATGADETPRVMCTLPEGYRPDTTITGMRMNGSGTTTWLLSIQPNGDVTYSRHTDSGVSGWVGRQPPNKWFACHATFPSA